MTEKYGCIYARGLKCYFGMHCCKDEYLIFVTLRLPRCIGRIAWKTLMVRDKRRVSDLEEMFQECMEHQRIAAADGRCLSPPSSILSPSPE